MAQRRVPNELPCIVGIIPHGVVLQNRATLFLQYPLRMIWERSIRNYRTPTRNKVFDVIDRLSIEYKKKTEENSVESSSEVKMCAG